MSLEVRAIDESELTDWSRALRTGFLMPPAVTKKEVEFRRAGSDIERIQGAFDDGRCVATFRSFAQRITVPGGAAVTASAVSNVTVSPTHRRRGLLSRMMDRDLRAAKERGEVASTLISAEYPIYGRYGYGPAVWTTEWEIDVPRAGLDRRYTGPADGGRVDLVDGADARRLGPGLHERLRAVRHGVVDRDTQWWQTRTGEPPHPSYPWTEPFYAVHRSASGSVDGLLVYTADDVWEAKTSQTTATVRDCFAVTPEAERALWHFLLSVDWIIKIRTGLRAPDDLLPLLLPDPRAARTLTHADFLWLRPLDVPALLEARTYATSGSLVLDIADPAGLAAGRYLLEAGPDGASCTATTRPADLSLPVGELGTLYLGDESSTRLAALGRVTEERPGALTLADALLRTARRPWCPDIF